MSVITELEKMNKGFKKTKIDVVSLTKADMPTKALVEKYFRYDGKPISRFHIPKITEKDYLIEVLLTDGKVSKQNLKFDTATDYFKRKMTMSRVARDLGVNVKDLDFSNYFWNDDYFVYDDMWLSSDYVDNKFMEEEEEPLTARKCYIDMDSHQQALDRDLFDELYSFCTKAVITRKVMLFAKVEQCLSILKVIIEYTDGLSTNTSGNMMKSLIKYKKYFEEYFTNEETKEFINSTSDIEIYASDETTHSDYIDTYVSVIRKLTAITSDCPETRDFVKGLIHNENDIFEEEILDKLYEDGLECISYIEDVGDSEDFTETIE